MAGMYRDGGAELVETFRAVHETGTLTSLDLASVDPSSPAALEDWPAILQETLPYVDFFVPSVEELAFMIDKPIFERLGSGSLASLSIEGDVIPLAKRALSLGSKVVMIKLGERGLYVASAQGFEGWGERSAFIPLSFLRAFCPRPGRDSAIAAFLASFLRGYSLERAATLAAAAGAACVEAFDALSGLRGLDELESKINSGWTRRPI
jgi:sugar/nucleoside kinase (ribokinase family)